eukprot:11523538-Ditylum_brightwellii.AAC.1
MARDEVHLSIFLTDPFKGCKLEGKEILLKKVILLGCIKSEEMTEDEVNLPAFLSRGPTCHFVSCRLLHKGEERIYLVVVRLPK